MSSHHPTYRSSFAPPVTASLILGVAVTATLYAAIISGPLTNPTLRRFCLSHWTSAAAICMATVALSLIVIKVAHALAQMRLTNATVQALKRLIVEGCDVLPAERPRWLEASWLSMPAEWQSSWFGLRLSRILALQLKRGRRDALEPDLQSLSKADLLRLKNSYTLPRLMAFSLPIVGLLGTTLLFSESANSIAPASSTPQEATAQLALTPPVNLNASQSPSDKPVSATAQNSGRPTQTPNQPNPYDPAIVALTLALGLVLAQFICAGVEMELLERIDHGIEDTLIEFLATDPQNAEATLFAPVKQMTADLLEAVHQIVEQQASVWSRSIAESQRQWSNWTQAASETIATNLNATITTALTNHAGRLEKIQEEGSRQIDTRWQQWQTTLSDQARAMSSQQKELIRQTEAIHQLVAATTDLRKLEETIHESIARIENIGRLEDASQCVGEAVAVLATSLERAGIIRGAPTRPRVVRRPDAMEDDGDVRKAA